MFDIISLQDCERLFFCIEENIDVWKETAFFQAVKNHILRICNGKQLYNQVNISKRVYQDLQFCRSILIITLIIFRFAT